MSPQPDVASTPSRGSKNGFGTRQLLCSLTMSRAKIMQRSAQGRVPKLEPIVKRIVISVSAGGFAGLEMK
jgi:hypothetical protein